MVEHTGKIFGIGLSRTGTTSLTIALKTLGINTVHFPNDPESVREVMQGGFPRSVFEFFRAGTDTPVAPFYAELDAAFPESKFILTVRDSESWLRSLERHMSLANPQPRLREYVRLIRRKVYGCETFNRASCKARYKQHVGAVRSHFKDRPSDLLTIDICAGQGWEVLCAFLGLAIPNVEFPHRNDGDSRTTWTDRISDFKEEISKFTPEEAVVALIDDDKLGISGIGGRKTIPFPERHGYFWGPPVGDEDAIRELERTRVSGVEFVAFCWPAFWWLEHYGGFKRHLDDRYSIRGRSDNMIVYDLREKAGLGRGRSG